RSSTIKGKLRYMAPEQIIRAPLDRRTDVFAAGVVLCEIVTGQRFWGELSDSAIVRHIHAGSIPTPRALGGDCPPELERICAKALAYEREQRYQSIAEMQRDLESYILANGLRITTQDLSREISALFADERRQAQHLIESHLSTDTYVSWSSIATASSEPLASKTPPATATRTILDLPTCVTTRVPAPARSKYRIAGLLIGMVLLASGAIGLSSVAGPQFVSAPTREVEPSQVRKMTLRITAFPSIAAISLDDQPVSHNPFTLEVAADGTVHRLRVEAPGHVSVARSLRFDQDIEWVVSLESEEPSVPVASLALERDRPQPVRPVRPAKRTQSTKPLDSCSPPYTYDSRGIKHFKTECL
ncbi:MAG TPA: protein kinase, partial [Polyangiaceae bacterium]|nr:protein kinase [Polyangiaceae bacterium]